MSEAKRYTVEVSREGCEQCGDGRGWAVIDTWTDTEEFGETFGVKEDAVRFAETLNEVADYYEGIIHAVISDIGGEVEGAPTARVNFLQRVHELVEREKLLQARTDVGAEKYWRDAFCKLAKIALKHKLSLPVSLREEVRCSVS